MMNLKKIQELLKTNTMYKKYELYIAPTFAGISVLALVLLVIVPNIFQYFETAEKITETEEKITFFQNKTKILQSIQTDQYTRGINNSLIILPADQEAPAAIAQLYYLINITSVNIQNISFSEGGGGTDGKSFRISLELSTSLSGLTNFILRLKESPRIMRINTLEVGSQGGTGDLFATVTLDAFYEPLPASISKIDQPVILPTEKDLEVLSRLNTSSFPYYF